MNIDTHRAFDKAYAKLNEAQKKRTKIRLRLFRRDPSALLLNNHALKGKYHGFRSINIGGDLRIIYKHINDDAALLVDIGTHSQLYK